MESADHEVLRTARDWLAAGQRVTLVTVAQTWGSSPRPVGSLLAINQQQGVVGSVSGGCVEEDLTERFRARRIFPERPELVHYGVDRDDARRFGLPCGGRLTLVCEPLADAGHIAELLRRIDARELIKRRVALASGEVTLSSATREAEFIFNEHALEKVFGPQWRLLVIGAGHLSRFVAQAALALDYQVIVCDPREEYARQWAVPGVEVTSQMPDDAVVALACDARSAVVALTHDPKLDDLALLEALNASAFYVGALGSRGNNAKRRQRLASLDIPPAALARLHGPVGLPIGSRTPAEIAVAIVAELTAVRHGIQLCTVAEPTAAVESRAAPLEKVS